MILIVIIIAIIIIIIIIAIIAIVIVVDDHAGCFHAMSPFLVFGSGLKASLVDASQCCWCWCCTSVGDDVDIDVDNMGVSSSHCVEPEWYHD